MRRGCQREMSGRRVSRLPSLKAPSPHVGGPPASPVPSSNGSDELREPTASKMFKRQTRSRRASLSSNENGSLTRDGQLSDGAFVEQLEEFRRQLLDLRKEKKKQEDEIIKYKLLCKEKHQTIGELNNKLEAEKANYYDLREHLTRDLTLQMTNQHAAEKKKLNFEMNILKNDKRKYESDIRLLETTNKGLFEEIRQIRSSYDTKLEKLMKDFHIEIYKGSGEKRKLEKQLEDTKERLTKEEFLSRQAELEKARAEEEAKGAKQRRQSTFGSDLGTLDRQNKKISELEDTIKKLESLKNIAESQNVELNKKLKENATKIKPTRSFRAPNDSPKDSPTSERKRALNRGSSKDKIDAAEKKLEKRGDSKASKKDLESYLKIANKERNVLERKIALLEKTRQQTGDPKIDNQLAALRQQHKELQDNIAERERYLKELESPVEEKKQPAIPGNTGLALPKFGKGPLSPRTGRKGLRSPSPSLLKLAEESEDEDDKSKKKKKDDPNLLSGKDKSSSEKKKFGSLEKKKLLSKEPAPKKPEPKEDPNIIRIDRSTYRDKEQQTLKITQLDQEIQVEFYEEEEEYDALPSFGQDFGFMELPSGQADLGGGVDPLLGTTHGNESLMEEYEEKLSAIQRLREKDMERITALTTQLEQYKQEVGALSRKAGSYYTELEESTTKLDSSLAEIEKLHGEIDNLKDLNDSLTSNDMGGDMGARSDRELATLKKDYEQMSEELRDKQLTIMKLHKELHETQEEVMDKSGSVRQLEALVENLKHDNGIMRDEQMHFETTTEEVLDQLRNQRVRNNQLEELVKSLEGEIETQKGDMLRIAEEQQTLQAEKEQLEVEVSELSGRMAARDMELESALSETATNSEASQNTLNLLQEIRQKDNTLKKIQKKHNETLLAVRKEVEKQVTQLQTKVARKDDDIATIKGEHVQNVAQFHKELAELRVDVASLRESLSEKERELEEAYSGTSVETSEAKELTKRLAELANDNMSLRDQLDNYRKELKEKRPAGFMGELGKRIQTQRPSYTDKKAPLLTFSEAGEEPHIDSQNIEEEEDDEEEEEEDVGELTIALVLYSYDPASMSPNDYPEDELPLSSGEFIYIFGEPDEDGFYTAELMTGERGLVPSNFVQRVELTEQKTQQMRRMSQTQRMSVALPAHLGTTSPLLQNKDIPVATNISFESIGSKTLEMSWELPESRSVVPIMGFKIFVNSNEFKVTDTGECRTILNELPPGRPLYISIQTLSPLGEGGESKPGVYGRQAIKAPESLDVTNVTNDSAVVTFVGQPHYVHGVFLNGEHVGTLQPGIFLYMLKRLSGETEYEIRIVTLQSEDSVANCSFALSQCKTFTTGSP